MLLPVDLPFMGGHLFSALVSVERHIPFEVRNRLPATAGGVSKRKPSVRRPKPGFQRVILSDLRGFRQNRQANDGWIFCASSPLLTTFRQVKTLREPC